MAVNTREERVEWTGVDKSLSSVTDRAAGRVANLRVGVDAVKNALGALGVTVSAAAMVTLYNDTLKATAGLDDMAESTGATVEGLSAIQRVAKVNNAEFDGLTGTIGRMIKGLKEGGEEGNKTTRALDFLGVKAKDTEGRFRDTDQVLLEVARRLEAYGDRGEKVALIQDILGKGAERYLPLLKEMADGTDLYSTVTAKQAKEAEEAEKAIRRLTVAMEDSRRELVNEYTPAITEFLVELMEARRAAGNVVAGGAMMLFTDTKNIRAELARLKADLAELEKPFAERSIAAKAGEILLGSAAFNMGRGQAISGTLQQIEFLEALQARRERIAARAGATDPQSHLFEFAGGGIGNYGAEDVEANRRNAELIARQTQEAADEEVRTRAEASALMAAQREKDLARERAILELESVLIQEGAAADIDAGWTTVEELKRQYDERNKILIAASDREQELAIEAGEQASQAIGQAMLRSREISEQILGVTSNREEMQAQHELRLEILKEALDQEIITFDKYHLQKQLLEEDHQENMYRIEDAAVKRRFGIAKVHRQLDLSAAQTFFGHIGGLMNTQSRKMFEIGKAGAIAETIVNTYAAAMGAWKSLSSIPFVGAGLGAAAAAAVVVAGLANVQRIRQTQFGGGGGATPVFPANPNTGVPTTPPPNSAPPAAGGVGGGVTVVIQVHGNVIGNQDWIERELIPGIREAVDQRDHTLIGKNSRQARDLAELVT